MIAVEKIKSPLVVGYKGDVGSFILNGLIKMMPKALNIWCVDINETDKEVKERIEKSNYIFLCVPLNKTVDWLLKWKNYLEGKIVIEQCSLKSFVCKNEEIKNIKIASMHLLFRPSKTPNPEDRKCIILKNQCSPNFIHDIVKITRAKIIEIENVAEHDFYMAFNQAIVHRTILALDNLLSPTISTLVGNRIKELADRIKAGDPDLYESIQNNPHTKDACENFLEVFNGFNIKDYMHKEIRYKTLKDNQV